jgi:hypothetical protein
MVHGDLRPLRPAVAEIVGVELPWPAVEPFASWVPQVSAAGGAGRDGCGDAAADADGASSGV